MFAWNKTIFYFSFISCCANWFRRVYCVVQRNKAIEEINEDVYHLKVAVETLKQYHQDDDDDDDDDDDEKGDEEKDDKPRDNDAAAAAAQ